MRFLCITIEGCRPSEEAAARCVESALQFGYAVEIMPALTPKDDPIRFFHHAGWNLEGFQNNPYSRLEPCVAAFLSHYECWRKCASDCVPTVILEHDAVFVAPIPDIPTDVWACNLAKPSFGRFHTPEPGIGPLCSKPDPHYLPGATGYYLSPMGAAEVMCFASTRGQPTDIYLNLKRFPFFKELFPWPIECREEISTIQKIQGCLAKHRKVQIVDANTQD